MADPFFLRFLGQGKSDFVQNLLRTVETDLGRPHIGAVEISQAT